MVHKAGKAAALSKFLDKVTLSQPRGGGGRLCPPIDSASPKKICDFVPVFSQLGTKTTIKDYKKKSFLILENR